MDYIIGFAVWIVITVIIEVGIALLFGYRNKHQLTCIAIANLATLLPLSI